jgi:hypothetical protein
MSPRSNPFRRPPRSTSIRPILPAGPALRACARRRSRRRSPIEAQPAGDGARRAQAPSPRQSVGQSAPLPSFRPYLDRHVTDSMIRRGQSRYSSQWGHLARIQQLYGVDPAVIMAIYGKETSYGAVTGNFDLLDALASLAYEGRGGRCSRRSSSPLSSCSTSECSAGSSRAAMPVRPAIRSSCRPSSFACGLTATATAMPTSGATRPTPSPRSPIICAMPGGNRAFPGACR